MDKGFLETAALETLSELGGARQKWVSAALALVDAEREMKLAEAGARQYITKQAGGAKAMGSNAELREYAMTIALAENLCYLKARADRDQAFEQEARAKQAMYTFNDALKLLKVLLETYTDPLKQFHVGG